MWRDGLDKEGNMKTSEEGIENSKQKKGVSEKEKGTKGLGDHILEQAPTTAGFLARGCTLRSPTAAVELTDTFDLLQSQFQQLFLADDVEVAADPRIFAGKTFDLGVGKMSSESCIKLSGEIIIELRQEFDVEEEYGC
jgi:hypothetical protein